VTAIPVTRFVGAQRRFRAAGPLATAAVVGHAAFDEGEYDHGDGCDPVEHYTIALLRSAFDLPTNDE